MSVTVDQTAALERLARCPCCAAERIDPLPVGNLNSRDPRRAQQLREHLGDDWFLRQRVAVCAACGLVFQDVRPTRDALQSLYDHFATAVAKVVPTPATAVHYLLVDNPQDYVHGAAKALAFLDRIGATDGVCSVLELRTYGGGLAALLRERGVEHVEAACLSEFDAAMAREIYGLDRLTPFSFAAPIEELAVQRERYDLIVAYEGLTHSRDPRGFVRWIAEHLAPGGRAVLMREPNTPEYRRILPLDMVFNNFHMNLLTPATARALVARETTLGCRLYPDFHPAYPYALYLNVVIGDTAVAQEDVPHDGRDHPLDWWMSWIRWEQRPALSALVRVRRAGGRVGAPVKAALGRELRGLRRPPR